MDRQDTAGYMSILYMWQDGEALDDWIQLQHV